MAWQLIYTSAPRLLDAGRSGFGTVARHRAIHPLLVAALERDSQFDRTIAAGRVIHAHRVLSAAGSRYHVLTCIREAGADYSGRTNHIAHHLVIDPTELAALGSQAPTPADVISQMNWRSSWSDAPRWLDGTEEIRLAGFQPGTTGGGDWEKVTGNSRHARLLQPTASAALLLTPTANPLALIAESLSVAPVQAWQATFTTRLQPTDDLGDFRWVAVSPVYPDMERAKAARTVLDLNSPSSLPAPAERTAVSAAATAGRKWR